MTFRWTPAHLERVRDYPHLIGGMVGKDRLTDLHSDWIKMIWDSPAGQHASLMSHRGAYKTTAITEVGIVYYLLFHPNSRIALVRETFTEAADTLETIKKYMQSELVRSLFKYAHGRAPEAVNAPYGSVLYSFKRGVTKEKSIEAHGIIQMPTGRHYDRILCDDIVTINSRISRAAREKVKGAVLEIMTNIIDPGCSCFFVGTPWHHDDAWAMRNDGGRLVIPEPWKYRPADTGILTEAELAAKRSTTTRALFAINYLLDTSVRDDGQIFDEPFYAPWDWSVPRGRIHAHVDAAWDGACTNALTIMGRKPNGRVMVWGKCYPGNINDCEGDMVKCMQRRHVATFRMEDNADKGLVVRDMARIEGCPRTDSYSEHMNKDVKIAAYLKRYWNYLDFDPDTDPHYIQQILDYRVGQDPRDCPDSAASLLREVFYPSEKGRRSPLNVL